MSFLACFAAIGPRTVTPAITVPIIAPANIFHSVALDDAELSRFFPFVFNTIETIVTTSKRNYFGTHSLVTLKATLAEEGTKWDLSESKSEDPAAIVFTSGATGKPKGVLYTHQNFVKQMELIQEVFKLDHSDIDLPAYPLFSL